jgi:DNA invertase Pin-like site-specific DNA recombinase
LVPERPGRREQRKSDDEHGSDLRPGIVGSSEGGPEDRLADGGTAGPTEWILEDEGYSGGTLIRPALERLRDLAAKVLIDVVLCYSPDRLARRYAYQALLIDEFAQVGTEVCFVNTPKGETPEDELLIQSRGVIAE